jgi:hypothetical protein
MNMKNYYDSDVRNAIFGTVATTEIHRTIEWTPLTKTEKMEILWAVFLAIGVSLQVCGLAFLLGLFFKLGLKV